MSDLAGGINYAHTHVNLTRSEPAVGGLLSQRSSYSSVRNCCGTWKAGSSRLTGLPTGQPRRSELVRFVPYEAVFVPFTEGFPVESDLESLTNAIVAYRTRPVRNRVARRALLADPIASTPAPLQPGLFA